MDEQLATELASGAACFLGELDLTWDDLLDALIERSAPGRPLDPLAERLALRQACARAVGGDSAGARGLVDAVARALGELRRAGVPPGTRVEGARARRLVAILEETERILAPIGAPRDARRAQAVRGGVVAHRALELAPRLRWEPADVELVLSLARHARVTLRLPWAADRPLIYGGIDQVLAAIEARGERLDLEIVLEDPAERGCAGGLVAALYGPAVAPAPAGGSPVTIVVAPHPRAEARQLAARIRRLIDEGAAPEDIAIALRQGDGELLAQELERAGVAAEDRRPRSLASAPPVRLALSLLALADRGYPREDVLALAASPYVDAGVSAAAVARLARTLGLRELAPDGQGLARLAAVPPLEENAELAGGVRRLLGHVAALPPVATAAEHARALRQALAELRVLERAGQLEPSLRPSASPAALRIERAIARDGEAAAALDDLLVRLPAVAAEVGFSEPLSRPAFAALLADLVAETRLRQGGARGGAVRVVRLEDLAARAFDHVFVPGLVDGAAPARALDDGVYGERERREINAAIGRRALPVSGDGLRTPFETLLLVHALAAARRGVVLSYPRTDDDRPLERSPFVDEVVRVAPWVHVEETGLSPIPPVTQAVAAGDALAAVALEALGDPEGRLPPRPRAPDSDVLLHAMARLLPGRTARVVELAAIERTRWRYFAGVEPAGPYVGHAGPLAAARAGGGPEAPIPARQLELLANCGFTYLAGRVLAAQPLEETEDAPTPQSLGRLAHRCLEVFYRERSLAGALPLRGDDGDRAALEEACARVFAAAEAQGVRGHPVLWRLGKERLALDLWRTVATEVEEGFGGIPTYFELPFGLARRGGVSSPPGLPALELGGLHLSGRIDRVDVVGDGHLVIDYKLGRNPGAKLRDAGRTELQLPIYAAAVQKGLGSARVDAAYVSLRDGSPSRTLSAALGAPQMAELLGEGLARRVEELAARVRAGELAVAPVDEARCLFCAYRTACRVVRRRVEEEEV